MTHLRENHIFPMFVLLCLPSLQRLGVDFGAVFMEPYSVVQGEDVK